MQYINSQTKIYMEQKQRGANSSLPRLFSVAATEQQSEKRNRTAPAASSAAEAAKPAVPGLNSRNSPKRELFTSAVIMLWSPLDSRINTLDSEAGAKSKNLRHSGRAEISKTPLAPCGT